MVGASGIPGRGPAERERSRISRAWWTGRAAEHWALNRDFFTRRP